MGRSGERWAEIWRSGSEDLGGRSGKRSRERGGGDVGDGGGDLGEIWGDLGISPDVGEIWGEICEEIWWDLGE